MFDLCRSSCCIGVQIFPHWNIHGVLTMTYGLSNACIKELDRLALTDFESWVGKIDTPERVHLIERYEKRLEVLDEL